MKGISSRVDRKGATLIVQTQDVAGVSSYIETLVYGSGRLIFSRKAPISAGRAVAGPSRLDKLMADAHRAVLDEIAAGRIDDRIPGPGR